MHQSSGIARRSPTGRSVSGKASEPAPTHHSITSYASRPATTDGSPSESRAGLGRVAGEDRHPAVRRVGLLVERPVDDNHALPPQLAAVGEVACLQFVELVVGHLRRIGRTPQDDDRVDVERVGDVGFVWHGVANDSAAGPAGLRAPMP